MALAISCIGVGAELALGMFTPWVERVSLRRYPPPEHPRDQLCSAGIIGGDPGGAPGGARDACSFAIACFGFAFLILTGSRTALAGCVVSLIAFWLLSSKSSTTVTVLSGVACLVIIDTFSSRTEWWPLR